MHESSYLASLVSLPMFLILEQGYDALVVSPPLRPSSSSSPLPSLSQSYTFPYFAIFLERASYIMPLEEDDQARVDAAIHDMGEDPNESRLLVLNATESQKLGPLSVACTILNRTIGR